MRTIRASQSPSSVLTASASPVKTNGNLDGLRMANEVSESLPTESQNSISTGDFRSGLQETAEFEANQFEFSKPENSSQEQEITHVPLFKNKAETTSVGSTISEAWEYIKDPCNSSNPLRRKANHCSKENNEVVNGEVTRGLNRPTPVNGIFGNSEIQNIANNIRSTNSSSEKVHLMMDALVADKYIRKTDVARLKQHPFARNPDSASQNEKKAFMNDVKKAMSLMDFQKNHADIWHANSMAKMDRAFDFSDGNVAKNLYELVQVADIEPLIELTGMMKDKLTENMDVAIRNGVSPKIAAGIVGTLDTMIDVLVPTNIVDLPVASKLLGKGVSEVGHLAKAKSKTPNKNLAELMKIRTDMKALVKQSRTPHGINSEALEELLSYTIGMSAAYKGVVTIDELRKSHRSY